jgi:hypothetical protein
MKCPSMKRSWGALRDRNDEILTAMEIGVKKLVQSSVIAMHERGHSNDEILAHLTSLAFDEKFVREELEKLTLNK